MRQLESGLPNEVQFGLNMLLWLTKTWALPLPKFPKLVSLLIANSGLRSECQARYTNYTDTLLIMQMLLIHYEKLYTRSKRVPWQATET